MYDRVEVTFSNMSHALEYGMIIITVPFTNYRFLIFLPEHTLFSLHV